MWGRFVKFAVKQKKAPGGAFWESGQTRVSALAGKIT
jgi:hypothetical protein